MVLGFVFLPLSICKIWEKDGWPLQLICSLTLNNREQGTIVGFGPKNDGSKKMSQLSQKVRSHGWCDVRYNASNADLDYRPLLKKELPDSFDNSLMCAMNK